MTFYYNMHIIIERIPQKLPEITQNFAGLNVTILLNGNFSKTLNIHII